MDRILHLWVDRSQEGKTILDLLREKGFSRNILNSMKTVPDAILLNDAPVFATTVLQEGDLLRIHVPETENSRIKPVPMKLEILFEDEDLLILNKPGDTPVHPSPGNYENTIANGVADYWARQGLPSAFRCVSRLDRDTTGALLLAKNPLSASLLSAQMKERKIRRTYLAVVEGFPPGEGSIEAPIARAEGSVITREVNFERGEPAVTHFRRLDTKGSFSLLELHLETGRTHQIRVHMKYLGYPLPGDYLYNPVYDTFTRQPLHSWKICFVHPVTGEEMEITAPVPEEFKRVFPSL